MSVVSQFYFTISPVPLIIIRSNGLSETASITCAGAQTPLPQPQLTSPPQSNPFLNADFSIENQVLTSSPVLPTPSLGATSRLGVPTRTLTSGGTSLMETSSQASLTE